MAGHVSNSAALCPSVAHQGKCPFINKALTQSDSHWNVCQFLRTSCFWEEGDNYLSLPEVNHQLHSLSNGSESRSLGCQSEIIRMLSPALKPESLCAPRFLRIVPPGQVCGNAFIAVMQHSPFSPVDIDFTPVTLWYAFLAPFEQ